MPDSHPSTIDQALAHNAKSTEAFTGEGLTAPPRRKLLVVVCMDARINVEQTLGLDAGDAHILRNAGGTVTDDVLRSAIVSTNVLGTREVMVINHTGCGMMGCTDETLRRDLESTYGPADDAPADFHTFDDLDQHIRAQTRRLREHPWIPSATVVRGFTYEVQTGRLREVDCG